MTKFFRALACLMTLLLLCMSISAVAAKAKPKPKPKPKVSTKNHATLGTTQLKGEYADIGSTYTLGKDSPMNLTLTSAEYSVAPMIIGDYIYYPKANEKLLVLHFTVHNPQPRETFARYDSWSIMAVDSKGENHEHIGDAGVEPGPPQKPQQTSKISFSMNMNPGQKVSVFTAIVVPAAGEIGKVIFKSQDSLVLRYLLSGKLPPLAAPFADPDDKTGASALPKVIAEPGLDCPISEFAFKFEGTSFSDKSLKDWELGEGNRFIFINGTVKNISPTKQFFRYDFLQSSLKDADGSDIEWRQEMLLGSRDTSVSTDLEPGQELKVRIPFEVPKDLSLKTYTITREDNRVYEFDVSGAK